MSSHSGRFGMRWLAGILAITSILTVATTASAIFPPIFPPPPPIVTPPPVIPTGGTTGDPSPPPVVIPPVHKTPEPAAIVTGLIGMALAIGYGLRRRKKAIASA